ncbi:Hemin uptake protein hemP [Burkholderiales bacterium 8X]|nr:Hemin uptake protein hemP [Burkholderiales bacterium 8X]
MSTSNPSFHVMDHASHDGSGRGFLKASPPVSAPLVESTQLLQGNKTVGILHNGSLYRLQATKLGKLILTK